jgi:hypothetical protein
MTPCHSQKNLYRANHKCWQTIGLTPGEQTCGSWRLTRETPKGTKLNNVRLQWPDALYVAMAQPGGAVIHKLDGGVFDVYSQQRLERYREILSQIQHGG